MTNPIHDAAEECARECMEAMEDPQSMFHAFKDIVQRYLEEAANNATIHSAAVGVSLQIELAQAKEMLKKALPYAEHHYNADDLGPAHWIETARLILNTKGANVVNMKDSVKEHYPLDSLAAEITEWSKSKGFETPDGITGDNGPLMLAKLMLVTTEVAEAAEAVRHKDDANFEEELADIIIRVLNISGACGLSMDNAIAQKMEINKTREHKHGKEM